MFVCFSMQQQSRTLDIITGFQVLDGHMHLFVLEGLRDGAVKEVWESQPQPENSGNYITHCIGGKRSRTDISSKYDKTDRW